MNLHIAPDNVFTNRFYENLQELGVLDNNKIVVRTNEQKLKRVQYNVPYARLYTSQFSELVGDTQVYEKVYIHQLTPLLYHWIANHQFNELNWMVWGADLYNLPSVHVPLYEHLTLTKYVRKKISIQDLMYRSKVFLLHSFSRDRAYAKISNVLTWMKSEYEFARRHLPALTARHQFFFYENPMPYQQLDSIMSKRQSAVVGDRPTYVLGNSSTPELNHLDAIEFLNQNGISSDIVVPVSYGDHKYASFLKRNLPVYKHGSVKFIDKFMNFPEYAELVNSTDGIIMNNIRPQGYGNIFMAMYMGKKVFLNEKNLSVNDLKANGLDCLSLLQINGTVEPDVQRTRQALMTMLSHERLLGIYKPLFC